jgi:hypothetical protein
VDGTNLHSMTPPLYTQSMGYCEATVDAEATQCEKREAFNGLEERLMPSHTSLPQHVSNTAESPVIDGQQTQEFDQNNSAPQYSRCTDATAIGSSSTEPVTSANLVHVRTCSILHDRPAIWLVRRKSMVLSSLAALVLIREGLIRPKGLKL